MNSYLMGIDNGGSAIKCAIFKNDGTTVSVCSRPAPPYLPGGFSNRDPEAVWSVNCQVIGEALEKARLTGSDIAALSVCGYGGGVCLVDQAGNATYPLIVSTDTRALPAVEELRAGGFEATLEKHTLQSLWPGQAAPLLRWFLENQPAVLEQSAHMLNIKDYIRLRLTGAISMEVTDASNFGLSSIYTGAFEPELIPGAVEEGLIRLVPHPFLRPTEKAGAVTPQAAAQTGLAPGTPVAAGLYDVAACALASGLTGPETLGLATGTWGIACFLSRHISPQKKASLLTYTYLEGYRLEEESGATCTCNLDWFIESFLRKAHPELPGSSIYTLCEKALTEIAPGEAPLFIPYLYCCATPADGGGFFGLKSTHGELHLLRGVMEGIVYSLLHYVEPLKADAGKEGFKRIRISGGITQSAAWTQMLCDMLALPLEVTPPQAGARGAAICAGVCCGQFADVCDGALKMVQVSKAYHPRKELASLYKKGYLQYQNALNALAKL